MSIIFAGDFLPQCSLERLRFPKDAQMVANLECAISDNEIQSSKAYSLVLGEETEECIKQSGFAALNLANNHVCDAGVTAFEKMQQRLENLPNTQFYGTKMNPFATLEEVGCRCAVIGCMEPGRSRRRCLFEQENVLGLIRRLAGIYDRIFITPHWGKEGEYAPHPSPRQRSLAKKWIRAGANAILGHHSHVFQGRERVGGSPIYYSLGNLVFDHEEGRTYPLTQFGMVVTWTPNNRPEDDSWQETYVFQRDSRLHALEDRTRNLLTNYLEVISSDLTDRRWSYPRWARAVGPVYIPKSEASWARRSSGRQRWKVYLLHVIWSLLPLNILLRWGNSFPDQHVRNRITEWETLILSKIK